MIGNTREGFAQIGFRVVALKFGGTDEALDRGGALTASIRAREVIAHEPASAAPLVAENLDYAANLSTKTA